MINQQIDQDRQARKQSAEYVNAECPDFKERVRKFRPYIN